MNMNLFSDTANFWTPLYGVFRWSTLVVKPGTYRLVWNCDALDFVGDHKTCVVDDFGNLVVVPV